jgi:hypothetical protein
MADITNATLFENGCRLLLEQTLLIERRPIKNQPGTQNL